MKRLNWCVGSMQNIFKSFKSSPQPPALNRKRLHSSPRTSGDESGASSGKKIRQNGSAGRRKASRRLPFDEDKSSPVSGTVIRELAEGEEIPAIHKGERQRRCAVSRNGGGSNKSSLYFGSKIGFICMSDSD